MIKAFSVIITGRNGKLEVARMNTEEPLDKANSGQPRVGYLPISFPKKISHCINNFLVLTSTFRFVFNLHDDLVDQGNITLKSNDRIIHFPFVASNTSSTLDRLVSTDVHEVGVGT